MRTGLAVIPVLTVVAFLASAGLGPAAFAHKPSDSTLVLWAAPHAACGPGGGAPLACGGGRWDIAVRDLDDALGIDADGNGEVTWGELRAREADAARYALDRLSLGGKDSPCAIEAAPLEITHHSDGAYVSLPLSFGCPAAARTIALDYRLLFELDAQHRGLVRIAAGGHPGSGDDGDATFVLDARNHTRQVALFAGGKPVSGALTSFLSFVATGVVHIWGGLDHVLFLLALLLPAVVRREGGAWIPVAAVGPTVVEVAKIVTAFTAAHSLTLSLAALGVLQIPARLTEPAIAASVVLAAANNLWPVFGRDRWVVAFALGLLHGFGFSSVLADLGLPRGRLLGALFGFNAGVELGQLAILAAFVPVAFRLRRTFAYRRVALHGGSAAIALVAAVWFIARILDIPTWS